MLRALEGKENCFWRLHKPIPFQYGRADCVRDEKKATTKFPFAATEHENHANPFGQGDWVLKELKRDFGMFLASLAPVQPHIWCIQCRYECSPDHCHDGSPWDLYSRSQQDHWRPLQVGIIYKLSHISFSMYKMGWSSVHIQPVLQNPGKPTSVHPWHGTCPQVTLGREGCLIG